MVNIHAGVYVTEAEVNRVKGFTRGVLPRDRSMSSGHFSVILFLHFWGKPNGKLSKNAKNCPVRSHYVDFMPPATLLSLSSYCKSHNILLIIDCFHCHAIKKLDRKKKSVDEVKKLRYYRR